MNLGIGDGKTREDHRAVADQLYAFYAQGKELERLTAIIGVEGLGAVEQQIVEFTRRFENEFLNQKDSARSIEDSLALSWDMLSPIPQAELRRVKDEFIQKYMPEKSSAATVGE